MKHEIQIDHETLLTVEEHEGDKVRLQYHDRHVPNLDEPHWTSSTGRAWVESMDLFLPRDKLPEVIHALQWLLQELTPAGSTMLIRLTPTG